MGTRISQRFRYFIERFVVRGIWFQLMLVASAILMISLGAGLLVHTLDPEFAHNASLGEAVWWAFLRLTDPGYLGDDKGSVRRVVSTVVTVLGYVLFMGSLVAVLTQWLQRKMSVLESGSGVIARSGHVLVVVNSDRGQLVVAQLFDSGSRMERFLAARGQSRLHLVVLAENSGTALRQEIKMRVGARWRSSQLTLRQGDCLRPEHLSRVDFARASSIILPSGDYSIDGTERLDTHLVKTLLTMSRHPEIPPDAPLPLVVAEVLDERRIDLVRSAYRGRVEIVPSNALLAQFVTQSVLYPNISRVYSALIGQEGSHSLRVHAMPSLEGVQMSQAYRHFDEGTPIGVLRAEPGPGQARFTLDPSYVIGAHDSIVVIASRSEHARPLSEPWSVKQAVARERFSFSSFHARTQRVAIFGWSHKVPAIVNELMSLENMEIQLDLVADVPIEERQGRLTRLYPELRKERIRHHVLDYTVPASFRSYPAQEADHVIFVGSDWLEGEEEADARSIMGLLMVNALAKEGHRTPHVVLEILDPSNLALLDTNTAEVFVSSSILSYMLSQVALQPELNEVYGGLFSPRGPDFSFRTPQDYGYGHQSALTFGQFQRDAQGRAESAIGVMRHSVDGEQAPDVEFGFSPLTALNLEQGDKLIVLCAPTSTRTGTTGVHQAVRQGDANTSV